MLKPQDLRELAENSFEVRCGLIRLGRSDKQEGQASSGSGYFRQMQTGELSLVMFVEDQPPSWKEVWAQGREAGELLADEDYYSLEAWDLGGRRWTASRIRPRFTYCSGADSHLCMAEATVREIRTEVSVSTAAKTPSLQVWYRGDIEFPFTTSIREIQTAGDRTLQESFAVGAAEFSALGCEYFVRNDDHGYLWISASCSEEHLPPNLEFRLTEALEFILARRLAWTCVAKHEERKLSWRVRGAPTNRSRGRMQPPVPFVVGDREKCSALLDLARCFLCRVGAHEGDKRPRLSVAVRSAMDAAHSPIDAHALDLAVAVEAVLNAEFEEMGRPEEDFSRDLDSVREAICSLKVSDQVKKRIGGLLPLLSSPSAKSRLRELEGRDVISSDEIRAWDKIRNKAAHGTFVEDLDQDYVTDFGCVLTLFYRLIFAAVGYEGPYMDYGEIGWPWRRTE